MIGPAPPPAWESPLDLRLSGRRRWMTLSAVRYHSAIAGVIEVPPGFITDLASVPRLPLTYLAVGGRAPAASVVHDYLTQRPKAGITRRVADAVFWEAMGVANPALGHAAEPGWISWAMWAGVRLGGWVAWRKGGARAATLNPIWTAEGWP